MKVILSRKGFDSSYGGVASPIIRTADGSQTLYSLPIPLERSTCGYEDISWKRETLDAIVAGLRRNKQVVKAHAPHYDGNLRMPNTPHLDPDLVADARKRKPGWRPMFGQSGGQETQLSNECVCANERIALGDRPLFLFFGWYKQAEEGSEGWRHVRAAANLHVVFGWLQVERKVILHGRADRVRFAQENPWAADHPHVACAYYDQVPNAVYVAPDRNNPERNRLVIGKYKTDLPAAGMFRVYDPDVHTLSWHGCCPVDKRRVDNRRTHWALPSWFYRQGKPTLGMHLDKKRWKLIDDDHVHLRSVGRGQEFVFDTADYNITDVRRWVERLIRGGQGRAKAAGA